MARVKEGLGPAPKIMVQYVTILSLLQGGQNNHPNNPNRSAPEQTASTFTTLEKLVLHINAHSELEVKNASDKVWGAKIKGYIGVDEAGAPYLTPKGGDWLARNAR